MSEPSKNLRSDCQRDIMEESKVANHHWVDHQACTLLSNINAIANLLYGVKLLLQTLLKNY